MNKKFSHITILKYFTIVFFLEVASLFAQLVGPKIYSTEKEYDFGNIVKGSVVSHNFEVINNGDAELKIYKVHSSCGCTAANPNKDILQPKESTKIKVTFNSSGRSGRQKKYINIFSNDKLNPRYRLVIYANILTKEEVAKTDIATPHIWVENTKHNFGTVKEGTVLTWDLKIKNIGDTTLIIKDVQTSCGCTAALLSNDNLEPGKSGNIKIEMDTSGMKGMKSRVIAVTSNDPLNPRTVITLFVTVEE
jgi:mRNA-degrading endonuclease toxin of MazEF toxin-antitoxin module